MNALRLRLHEHAREHVHEHAEAALKARPINSACRREHSRHAALLPPRSTIREQLGRHSWWAARRARERERQHPFGVQHADDLRDHAAHRRADDVGALDTASSRHAIHVFAMRWSRTGLAGRRRTGCRGCRPRGSGGDGRTHRAGSAQLARRRRGPGSTSPAIVAPAPTCCTRCRFRRPQ